MTRFSRTGVRSVTALFLLLCLATATFAAKTEHVVILSDGSRQELKAKVQAAGGTVRHEFKNVVAVSATIPTSSLVSLLRTPGLKIKKVVNVYEPKPRDPKGITTGVVKFKPTDRVKFDVANLSKTIKSYPTDYSFNNDLINATAVQATGNLGQGVVVAVIDSGTANNPDVVPSLDGTVIGGENFVEDDPVSSATSTLNGEHGTWVGTMIAGHVGFVFSNNSCLVQSLQLNAPDSVIDGSTVGLPGQSVIPMVGVAPAASIYALKVFSSLGGGTGSDVILAAMDRAITLKKNYLAGMSTAPVSGSGTEDDPFVYDALNIQVVNMSLGGPTTAAGRELEDLLSREMVKAGITLVTSAGNAGPASLTTGTPATGVAALSSAASNTPPHERVFWDVAAASECSVGLGLLARPNDTLQTASFSSRGPTADGRVDISVTSAGYFNFVQSPDGSLSLVAGTSFSAPTVSGAAALLQAGVPTATAAEIRNAVVKGANYKLLGDGSTQFDQGRGYLDVAKSLDVLKSGAAGKTIPNLGTFLPDVGANLNKLGIGTTTITAGTPLKFSTGMLRPGQRKEFIVKVGREIGSVSVSVDSVTPKLPPDEQNLLFGDDIYFSVHQAKTSAFGEGDYPVQTFVAGPRQFTIANPEPGYMRVVVLGDWTNAGRVSSEVTVTAKAQKSAKLSKYGTVSEGELVQIPYTVASGVNSLTFELTWNNDWSHYPTNDLDLIVVDPDGNLIFDGATLNGREMATVASPKPGNWMILVDGFNIWGKLANDGTESGPQKDSYRVRVVQQ
jgi:subtilisin family serine protease